MSNAVDCIGCSIGAGSEVVTLPGGWTINHYGGTGAILGWLVLQPKEHRNSLADLTESELSEFGTNMVRVTTAMRQVHNDAFPSDPIERIYMVQFGESGFNDTPIHAHLHIHLIPRAESLRKLLRNGAGVVDAWEIPHLRYYDDFPERYRPFSERVNIFMDSMRRVLEWA